MNLNNLIENPMEKLVEDRRKEGFEIVSILRSKAGDEFHGIPCDFDELDIISKNKNGDYRVERLQSAHGYVDGVWGIVNKSRFPLNIEYDRKYSLEELRR